jgi:phospholipase/carboxylesterase
MLHGLGDSIEGYRWMPEALGLPWLNYLLVNAPDKYFGGFSWFDFAADIVPGVERSRRLLFELIDAQVRKGFPPGEMTIGGFSQGCLMAIDVGLRYPQRFAGIVGISGFICEPEKLVRELSPIAREQRLLITHGVQDPIVPYAQVRSQVRVLESAGLNIQFQEYQKAHTIAGEDEIGLIRNFMRAGYPDTVGR